jgi:hypothetical protein
LDNVRRHTVLFRDRACANVAVVDMPAFFGRSSVPAGEGPDL